MDRKEILRYLRTKSKTTDEKILSLVDTAQEKIIEISEPKTLYRIFDCTVTDSSLIIGKTEFKSVRLAQHLEGCTRVAVFGATLGLAVDRLIALTSKENMSLAMAYQAAAAAYIEEVCDSLEEEIKESCGVLLRSRYSPGYFDLDVTEQRKLFSIIDITKRIGITLSDSCQMMPSKSVTAFSGIEDRQ